MDQYLLGFSKANGFLVQTRDLDGPAKGFIDPSDHIGQVWADSIHPWLKFGPTFRPIYVGLDLTYLPIEAWPKAKYTTCVSHGLNVDPMKIWVGVVPTFKAHTPIQK